MADRKPLVQVSGQVQEIPASDILVLPAVKAGVYEVGDVCNAGSGSAPWLFLGSLPISGSDASTQLLVQMLGGDWADSGLATYSISSFGQTTSSTSIAVRILDVAYTHSAAELYSGVEFKAFRDAANTKVDIYARVAGDYVATGMLVYERTAYSVEIVQSVVAILPTAGVTELTVNFGWMPSNELASTLLLRNSTLARSTLFDITDPAQVASIDYNGSRVAFPAKIQAPAATVNSASLRILQGVTPTAPGLGDVWSDGAYIYWRNTSAADRTLVQTAGLTTGAIPKTTGSGILADGLLSDTGTEIRQASGLARYYNPNLTDNVIAFTRGTAASPDSVSAFVMRMDGTMSWGAGGSSARDVTLSRSAANVLRTDGNFDVGIDLRVAGTPRITAGGAATMATVSAANLTAGRVVLAGASGLLQSDAGLTYSQSGGVTRIFTLGDGLTANSLSLVLNRATISQYQGFVWQTAGVVRWDASVRNGTDDLSIWSRTSGGIDIDAPISIANASAGAITLGGSTNRPIVIAGSSRLRFGTGLDFYKSGDSAAIHFKTPASGTKAFMPDVSGNAGLGTPGYRWSGLYAELVDVTGSITTPTMSVTSLTAGRAVFVGASDTLVDDSAFLFDAVKKDFGVGVSRTIVGSTSAVSEAAEILIATGSYMSGLYELRFDHTNRVERIWFRLNCQAYQDQPIITVVQYFSYNNAKCFGTIRVRRSADSATMYLTVTVSNLNGGTGGINVVAKLLDAAAPTGFTVGGTLPGSTVSLKTLVPDDVVGYKSTSGADFASAVIGQAGFTGWGTASVPAYWHIGQGAFNAARVALASKTEGDTYSRYLIKEAGLMEWGDGTNVRDTNLYRATAGRLQTDDVMVATGGFRALNYDTAPIAGNGPGLEMHYDSANSRARVLAFDRTTSTSIQLALDGSPINFYANGVLKGSFDSAGDFNVVNLTSGRIVYTTTNGGLRVASKLTYSGGNTLVLGDGTASADFTINKSDAGTGAFRFQVAGVERGSIGTDSSENFFWESKNSSGTVIDQPLTIVNSVGGAMTIVRPLTLTSSLSVTGTTTLATSLSGLLKATSGVVSAATAADVTGQLLTGYVVGANTALAATDTILGAFGKIQGQLNAKLSANQTITLSGVVTGSGTTAITTSMADGALSIAKTSGLQTALDGRVLKAGDTMTGGLSIALPSVSATPALSISMTGSGSTGDAISVAYPGSGWGLNISNTNSAQALLLQAGSSTFLGLKANNNSTGNRSAHISIIGANGDLALGNADDSFSSRNHAFIIERAASQVKFTSADVQFTTPVRMYSQLFMNTVQILTTQQNGMGTTLPSATIGGTYNSTVQAQLQAAYDKIILLEEKLKIHGLIAN